MKAYIDRLRNCGYSIAEARCICIQILKEYGINEVKIYVINAERDKDVEKV